MKKKQPKFYLINDEGKKVWKFELSSPAVIIELTEKGILYFTDSRANLVEYEKVKETSRSANARPLVLTMPETACWLTSRVK